jgi:hypothetical protein
MLDGYATDSERIDAGDLLLIGTASHKFSRLLAKDKVTSPLRAPSSKGAVLGDALREFGYGYGEEPAKQPAGVV